IDYRPLPDIPQLKPSVTFAGCEDFSRWTPGGRRHGIVVGTDSSPTQNPSQLVVQFRYFPNTDGSRGRAGHQHLSIQRPGDTEDLLLMAYALFGVGPIPVRIVTKMDNPVVATEYQPQVIRVLPAGPGEASNRCFRAIVVVIHSSERACFPN